MERDEIKVRVFQALMNEHRKGLARQAKNPRAYHNPYFLDHMCRAQGELESALDAGEPLRYAICNNFLGSLCNAVLKAVGEPKTTKLADMMYYRKFRCSQHGCNGPVEAESKIDGGYLLFCVHHMEKDSRVS